MPTYGTALAATAAVCIALLSSSRDVHAQTSSSFAGANVVHVGLVIRDIDKAVRDYADFFGVPIPKVMESKGMPWPEGYIGDRAAWARIAMFRLNGMLLDLVSPVGGASPWRNHLDRAGEGLQHLAIEVNEVDAAVADLVKRGGKHEMGAPGFPSQYVNMQETLGVTFEILKMGIMKAAGFDKGPLPTKFASGEVEHVGVVVRDADKAAKLMADILGIAPPKATVHTGLAYPRSLIVRPRLRSPISTRSPLVSSSSSPQAARVRGASISRGPAAPRSTTWRCG